MKDTPADLSKKNTCMGVCACTHVFLMYFLLSNALTYMAESSGCTKSLQEGSAPSSQTQGRDFSEVRGAVDVSTFLRLVSKGVYEQLARFL